MKNSALKKIGGVVLLSLLDVGLAPMPQILCLLNFPHFLPLISQNFPSKVMLLQGAKVFAEAFQSIAVLADPLEFLEDNALFEAVEGDLKDVEVRLAFNVLDATCNDILVSLVISGVDAQFN